MREMGLQMAAAAQQTWHEEASQTLVRRLRIVVIVDPEILLTLRLYEEVERTADMLVRGLVQRCQYVTLFANRESQVGCRLLAGTKTESMLSTTCGMSRGRFSAANSMCIGGVENRFQSDSVNGRETA